MNLANDRLTYREVIDSEVFHYGAEVVTYRGYATAGCPDRLASMAKALLDDSRIGWISITDNPGGMPMQPPDCLARMFPQERDRIVVHLSCKDMNRNGLESTAWRCAADGIDNILALTGDYPTGGFGGMAEPVFDFDSMSLIAMLHAMNRGLEVPGRRGKVETLPATHFFIGCCVSPFKRHERELMPQYFKLLQKIRAGAQWVIPQLGYDMRKFHEIKLFLESHGLEVPLLGNVYVLTKGVARMFHSGKLAGCVVSDELLELANRYGAGDDKGKSFFYELAAKQLAVFKGLGFSAGYLGGLAKADDFFKVIDLAKSYGENDWRDFLPEIQFAQPDEFFLFEHDKTTGMSSTAQVNREYVESLAKPRRRRVPLNYRVSRWVHRWFFTPEKGMFPLLQRLYSRWENKPGLLGRLAYRMEKLSKSVGYGCQDCGDCSLPDCAYLCPEISCSKSSRNGPCGGSANGRCELDDKDCLWARAYDRLKSYGESEAIFERPVVIKSADLKHTSSWANAFLGRDHTASSREVEDDSSKPNIDKPSGSESTQRIDSSESTEKPHRAATDVCILNDRVKKPSSGEYRPPAGRS